MVGIIPERGVELQAFPVPLSHQPTAATLVVHARVAINRMRNLGRLVTHCIGENPIVCYPSAISLGKDSACEMSLITNKNIQENCRAIVDSDPVLVSISDVPNHVILSTWGETIEERCPKSNPKSETLTQGVYEVAWQGSCVLATETTQIQGVVTVDNRRISDNSEWKTVNLSFDLDFSLSKFPELFKPNIDLPGNLPPIRNILLSDPSPLLSAIHWSSGKYYYLYLLCLIVLLIPGIGVLVWYCKCRKVMPKIDGESEPNVKPEPTAPTKPVEYKAELTNSDEVRITPIYPSLTEPDECKVG